MAAQTTKAWAAAILLAASFCAASALAQNANAQATTNIVPVRPEFTRPGGMPGAPRAMGAEKERYMRAAPTAPPRPVRKKRRRPRR